MRLPKLQAPVQNISLEVDLFTGLAHLRRLQADIVGAQAQAQGKLYVWPPSPQEDHWSGRLELGAQLPKLSLASLSKALGLKVPLEGSLDTEVALEGNLKSPQAKGKLSSARVRLAEQELRNLEVAFNFKDRLLHLAGPGGGGPGRGRRLPPLRGLRAPISLQSARPRALFGRS